MSDLAKNVKRIRKLYRRYLKGKRVALVGPAANILGTGQGKLIDSFDVVVRLKKALSLPTELEVDLGKRCDVLYHSMNFNTVCGGWLDQDLLRNKGVKFFMGVYPPVEETKSLSYKEHFAEMTQRYSDNLAHVEVEWFSNTIKAIGALPNTGTMAILDLLNHEIASLYVTGITFFQGGYIPAYHLRYTENEIRGFIKEVGLHRTDLELAYILKIFNQDQRVTWYDQKSVERNDKDTGNIKHLKIQNTSKYRVKLRQIREKRNS
jgi:hypothetical protein